MAVTFDAGFVVTAGRCSAGRISGSLKAELEGEKAGLWKDHATNESGRLRYSKAKTARKQQRKSDQSRYASQTKIGSRLVCWRKWKSVRRVMPYITKTNASPR